MKVRWDKAAGWILIALMFYVAVVFLMTGCAGGRPQVFSNGDKVEVWEVHEADMVPEEKER